MVFAGARRDVPELLRASTLAALPSLTEALPTSLIEAGACGLAAVATAVGGVAEVVEHERSGLLVPPGDATAFGAGVATLLADAPRREGMQAHARAIAVEQFDVDLWAASLDDSTNSCCRGGPRRRLASIRQLLIGPGGLGVAEP